MAEMRFSLPEDLLETISRVMQGQGIDFFIVGAIARDINLSANPRLQSPRITEDVDIALRIASIEQFQAIIAALIETGDFEMTSGNPIKLMYKNSIELDILPFGNLETKKREVHIPISGRAFILSVPGLQEVKDICKEISLLSGIKIHYCPLEGIVLLKLISWNEKPARTKDRDDIAHICKVYFEYAGDEIYEEAYDLLQAYDTNDYEYQNLVASHYLGRKVKQIIKEDKIFLKIINDKLGKYDGHFRALLDGINDKM